MCAHSVCLPTPDEARNLIRKGYAARMAVYRFAPGDEHAYVGPAVAGRAHEELPRTNMGPCSFFSDGLCELHDLGLKPLEGRLACHDRDWRIVRLEVQRTWKGKSFQSVAAALKAAKS